MFKYFFVLLLLSSSILMAYEEKVLPCEATVTFSKVFFSNEEYYSNPTTLKFYNEVMDHFDFDFYRSGD